MARRRRVATTHGLVIADKPAGVTSHDVVDQLRRRFGERQVGHAGTLDPDATGVLLVGVGQATRLLKFLSGMDKDYSAEVVLGVETNTLDSTGDVTARHDMSGVSLDDARRIVAAHLTGDIEQVPPMVSALKVDGRRLHELAREGIEVERAARPVHVARFEVEQTADDDVLRISVTCSSGTYVRTLAADLGRLLGGGAHLRALRRTRIGPFVEAEAEAPDTASLLPVMEVMRGYPVVTVDAEVAALIANGRVLPCWEGSGPWAVMGSNGALLGVYEHFRDGEAKPSVVLGGGDSPDGR